MRKKIRWNIISFMLAMILAVMCGVMTYYNVCEPIDMMITDMLFSQIDSEIEDVPIRIIAVDEQTISELGEFDTWSRSVSAELVRTLMSGEEQPIVIGLDMLYEKEMDEEGDLAFVEACRNAGNICLVVRSQNVRGGKTPEKNSEEDDAETKESREEKELIYPYEALRAVVQTGIGDNFIASPGDTVRELTLSIQQEGSKMESFSALLYQAYQIHAGRESQLDEWSRGQQLRFNYSRSAGEYETYSLIDVLEGRVDVSRFANTIVIVGDYTTNSQYAAVPQVQGKQMADAALQANIVEAMLSMKLIKQFPDIMMAVLYGGFIFMCYYVVFLMKRKKGLLITFFVILIHFQLVIWLRNQYYIPFIPLWLFTLWAMFGGLLIVYIREKRNRAQLVRALETYVEPQLVEQILENPSFDPKLGGEKRDIAVLFVDIRGFTSLSEALLPEQIVSILNEYLELIARAVIKNDGTLDKFIGDAAMAFYNAPADLPDYELRAVRTAIDILDGAGALNEHCKEKYGKEVAFGIGIHCGSAVVGNIGCECRMDYTAVGDTVNTASRLEANAKAGQILISADLYERLIDVLEAEFIGELKLKGKSRAIAAYEVKKLLEGGEQNENVLHSENGSVG